MQISYKHPYLFKFYRDSSNNRIIERISYQSYFYVPKTEIIPKDNRILKVEDSTKDSLFGEKLYKITVASPLEVPKIRMLFGRHFEADIKFTDRYFIDCVEEVPRENLRKCYFDLETEDFPCVTMDDKKITCVGFYDNYENHYYTLIISTIEKTEEREGHTIHYLKSEEDVLNKFIDLVRIKDYDWLIAHNGDRFDFTVFIGRIQKLALLNYSRMSPIGTVKRDNRFGEWKCEVGGRVLFDFMGTKTNFGTKGGIRALLEGRDITVTENGEKKIKRIKRWGLDYLASFVGMKKGNIKKLLTEEDMIQYNKLDVEIMVTLDNYFKVTEYYQNMATLIGCNVENTYFNTLMIDSFLLKRYKQFAFPSKPEHGRGTISDKIKGATVDIPKTGLYKLLYDIDQTSLYPTAIISYNLSPEVVSEVGDIIVGNGIRTDSSRVGMIPDAVGYLLDIRLKYKQMAKEEKDPHKSQLYDLISNGYKILLVSFYGALLYQGFRLYDYKVAEAIPFSGREIKEHVRKICYENGYEVIQGDTDSSFISPITEKATEINKLVEIINKSFDEFATRHGIKKHRFNIELDKIYSPILVSDVKKRYVGYVIKKGERIFKITGFESIRRDTAPITEEMQETIFKIILNDGKRKDVEEYITKLKESVKHRPLIDMALPKGFSKKFDKYETDSPWVRGTKYSNANLGTKFDEHSDIAIIWVKGVPEKKAYTDVVAISKDNEEIINGFTIDWDLMYEKAIDTKVERIYEMMGWGDTKQKSLLEF